ncbi:MAG: erythromycin esterase family protein, partial [Planctomycetota bacterium]
MKTRRKRLLITGILLASLIAVLPWLLGMRMEHVEFFMRTFFKPPELSAEETAELHKWLRDKSVHLKTVAAGSGFDDMQPLKAIIGDAHIVALGEDAHHNRSFSRAKHRMVEFLVDEMGFTVFAIEATFSGALELNDYVLGGEGDSRRALGALSYPAWIIESILDMVIWMREYNSTHEKKVKFYGFDFRPVTTSAKSVYNYLKKTNGTEDYDHLLSTMTNNWTLNQLRGGHKEELHKAAEKIQSLIKRLEQQAPRAAPGSLSALDSQEAGQWHLVVQHTRVLLQYIEFWSLMSNRSKATDFRDKTMAENVRWIADYEEGAKIILWAANPHVMATPGSGCMGAHLRETYGKDMVVFGLLRDRGSEGPTLDNKDRGFGAPKGSVEALLTEAGLDIAVVDLRSLPEGAVSKYFNAPRKSGPISLLLPWAYDAILFIESTTTARLVKEGILRGTAERLPTPSNLDFEELEDGTPKDWRAQGGQSRLEFQTTGSHDQPYQGNKSGMIKRVPGRPFGEPFGNIRQSIKASDYRGKKVRFTAAVRVDEGIGYLWLSVDVPRAQAVF